MIFVIDIRVSFVPSPRLTYFHGFEVQDLYQQPITKLAEFIVAAYHDNPGINVEVFVHKAEKLAEDDKLGKFSFRLPSTAPLIQ
jgi:hypothetical protein